MAIESEKTPEDLHKLRTSVNSWLKKALTAVWSFKRENDYLGTFKRGSDETEDSDVSSTTTARCFMAIVYAERQIESMNDDKYDHHEFLLECFKTISLTNEHNAVREKPKGRAKGRQTQKVLNNFEVAHVADLLFAKEFCNRFKGDCIGNWQTLFSDKTEKQERKELIAALVERLGSERNSKDSQDFHIEDGQMCFNPGQSESRHFFVTLHTLRALSILGGESEIEDLVPDLAAHSKRFCIDQCFFMQRGMRHQLDPARLVFSSLIYCMYAEEVDREVMLAVVEAIRDMQEQSGKWASTRPIIRKTGEGKMPWYIASPELALCLTWLYFQPRLPDSARAIVLEVLESHFQNWIIPTYRRHGETYRGWYDDGAAGHERVVGWTTGIVCHFLANYCAVLNDHINRVVIESLSLGDTAKRYLIDETATQRNKKWTHPKTEKGTWPDLPPTAWTVKKADALSIKNKITWEWSDPTLEGQLSAKISEHVISPIQNHLRERPKQVVSGILGGPPGTRKTSFVKVVSEVLNWPYVPVPASVIFDAGFDKMEAKASEVFRRLNYLTQCVIFFDEFEEFFRSRSIAQIADKLDDLVQSIRANEENGKGESASKDSLSPEKRPTAPIHDRTVAAFTTAAMLPRLQDLHDGRRSLILLATNNAKELDSAITRAGRFDFQETIDYPQISRFTKGSISQTYFGSAACGWRNLEKFSINIDHDQQKIESDEGKKRLKKIAGLLKDTLSNNELKSALEELQPLLRDHGSEIPENASVDSYRIKFDLIEAVTELLEGNLDDKDSVPKAVTQLREKITTLSKTHGAAGELPEVNALRR